MILSVLFALAVAAELFLFVGKDYLLNKRRHMAIEASVRQVYVDLKESETRIEARRAALLAAVNAADARLANMIEADKSFATSHKVMPVLVHTVGDVGAGLRFRASLSKELPATPEASQQLIWRCKNLVEVWAADIGSARDLASKQFRDGQGYDIGEFIAVDSRSIAA